MTPVPKLAADERERRRDRVVEGARMCFARWGYAGTTVRRLEEQIGLSRGAIFNYFPDKWHLLLAVAADDMDQAVDALEARGIEGFVDLVEGATLAYRRAYIEVFGMIGDDPVKRKEWGNRGGDSDERMSCYWQRQVDEGILRTDVPTEDLAQFAMLVVDGILLQRMMGFEYPRDRIRSFLALMQDAITPGPRPRSTLKDPG
jgi:AcrR family transcriptional regulator